MHIHTLEQWHHSHDFAGNSDGAERSTLKVLMLTTVIGPPGPKTCEGVPPKTAARNPTRMVPCQSARARQRHRPHQKREAVTV